MYQVDQFSAIITPPQAAILAVGGIADKVVAVKGQIEVRPRMTLTISCDHRVADGARAAQFLNGLAEAMHEPEKFLQ
jgi:pyruvate dehydrogenase E2 component (dihydrolipoamide acetyltransferase)